MRAPPACRCDTKPKTNRPRRPALPPCFLGLASLSHRPSERFQTASLHTACAAQSTRLRYNKPSPPYRQPHHEMPVLQQPQHPGHRLAAAGRNQQHPAAAPLPALRSAFQHFRNRGNAHAANHQKHRRAGGLQPPQAAHQPGARPAQAPDRCRAHRRHRGLDRAAPLPPRPKRSALAAGGRNGHGRARRNRSSGLCALCFRV